MDRRDTQHHFLGRFGPVYPSHHRRLNARLIAAALGLAAALAIAVLTASVQVVEAHANLVRSTPTANSVLDESPQRVIIWFTEPLEERFSTIEVLNSRGERVDSGDSIVDANDATVMSVGLPPLTNGTYTVAWRNLSTVDGHRIRSVFVFSVGEPIAPASPTTSPDLAIDQPLFQTPSEPAIRWLILLGALALTGGLGFDLLVMQPVLRDAGTRSPLGRLRGRMNSRSRRLLWWASVVMLGASLAQLLTQTAALFETSLTGAVGAPAAELLTQTEWGRLWMWRIGLLILTGLLIALPTLVRLRRNRHRQRLASGAHWLALLASIGVLLSLSLTSHAAATPGIAQLALVNDMLHICAAAIWVGGLFHLIIATPLFIHGMPQSARRAALMRLVRRFSVAAALSVGILILTGAYSAWAQVTALAALSTPYGTALIVKVALIAPLLLLGAVNLIWVRPRLRGSGSGARWLRRIVVGEVVLAVLVILSVGFLTSLEPARQVASRLGLGEEYVQTFSDTAEGADISLSIEPAQVGANTLTVSLADARGDPIANAADVRLRVSYLDADFGEQAVSAVNVGGGEYVVADSIISIAGAWQVDVLVQRTDAFDARTAFRFEVASEPDSVSSASIAPDAANAGLYMGIMLVLLGFLFLGTGIPMGGWYNRSGASVMVCGAAAFIVGLAFVVGGLDGGGASQTALRNPILPTSDSIDAGKMIYELSCQSCHGQSGRGDGPAAAGLEPMPADLVVHVPLHADAELFGFISDGIEGTAMAPLSNRLTEDEIWHVVNYIKTLAE